MIINLTSAAVILWSGMLIIAGTLLVLSSQVRHLVDLLENRSAAPAPEPVIARRARVSSGVGTRSRYLNAGPRVSAVTTDRSARRCSPMRDPA